jgi:hypothetical protein
LVPNEVIEKSNHRSRKEETMASKRWIGALLATALIVSSVPQSWGQGRSQAQTEPGAGATAAAVASNVLYVPGKVIVCTTSGVLWIATMALTLGTLYREAGEFVEGGCGGKWVVTPEDMDGRNPE